MTFNDIFKSSFLESVSEFSLLDTLIGLAAALIASPLLIPALGLWGTALATMAGSVLAVWLLSRLLPGKEGGDGE